MDTEYFVNTFQHFWRLTQVQLSEQATYIQASVIIASYFIAYWIYSRTVKKSLLARTTYTSITHPIGNVIFRLGNITYPLVAIVLLRISLSVGESALYSVWLINAALNIAVLFFFYSIIKKFVASTFMSGLFRWVGLPIVLLHLLDVLPIFIETLE